MCDSSPIALTSVCCAQKLEHEVTRLSSGSRPQDDLFFVNARCAKYSQDIAVRKEKSAKFWAQTSLNCLAATGFVVKSAVAQKTEAPWLWYKPYA
jgi:hypothetical protein